MPHVNINVQIERGNPCVIKKKQVNIAVLCNNPYYEIIFATMCTCIRMKYLNTFQVIKGLLQEVLYE